MTQNETFGKNLEPLENEKVEDFVERVAGERSEGVTIVKKIQDHYGHDHRKSKQLVLDSRSYWRRFFLDRIKKRFDSEGSRYGALRFVQRKNDRLRDGEKIFSEEEVVSLVDSFGRWKK